MSLGSSEALATLGAAGAAAAYSIPPVFTELFELCKYDDGYQVKKIMVIFTYSTYGYVTPLHP